MTRINIGEWQAAVRTALASIHDSPGLEAQLLLAYALGQSRTWVLAHPETVLSAAQLQRVDQHLTELLDGTPLPYITGVQEFYGLALIVSPAVLIPRPETEHLVERALDWMRSQPAGMRAADIGAGSGCIAISLAKHAPGLHVDAVDRSFDALRIASQNTHRHQVTGRVHLIQGDLTTPLRGPYSLICANLPYIPTADLSGLSVARHEPLEALDGGADGLAYIQRLLSESHRLLTAPACVLLEIEYRQAAAVTDLARAVYPGASIQTHTDLAGLDRVIEIRI